MKIGRMNAGSLLLRGIVCVAIALGAAAGLADSDDKKREHDAIRSALQRGEALPLTRILSIAQQAVPGDVIEVEIETKKDALIYEIKVLTANGRVREVKIDARTGSILKIEDD
ncbi:putative membrane protein YkoI [Povalibacter uvarum]|uniref:Putative membrane protein YkoI n=1 Tax=Povalibacter uvarum TaxID=732238 RepID=A0A841HML0_9GAMM|nr:PepSY domain-containing protein [Povalibacter uvarum]MBB6093589.1 putative membrane protein YkoI [Povalibacter uvarum]